MRRNETGVTCRRGALAGALNPSAHASAVRAELTLFRVNCVVARLTLPLQFTYLLWGR